MARQGTLPFLPESIGAWWNRNAEIDVLAISRTEKIALVGECKWSIKPVGVNVLEDLKQKAQVLIRTGEIGRPYYALFSRSGFTSTLEAQAQENGVMLFTVDQIGGTMMAKFLNLHT